MDISGRTLSHYRVVMKLGQGASGLVYLAEDLVLGRAVVLKRLPPDASESDRARALVEARTIAALNHPNICTLYEYEEADDEQFLVLEVLEGQTLEELIAQGPLPLAQVLDLGVQLADALDAAHTHGIVHRDIKPPNVFVTFRGQAKILDFGIATLSSPVGAPRYPAGTAKIGSNALYGTLHYIAPEQIRGEIVDGRADLFSLGALLYEMATGARAFDGADPPDVAAAILDGTVVPMRTLRADDPGRTGAHRRSRAREASRSALPERRRSARRPAAPEAAGRDGHPDVGVAAADARRPACRASAARGVRRPRRPRPGRESIVSGRSGRRARPRPDHAAVDGRRSGRHRGGRRPAGVDAAVDGVRRVDGHGVQHAAARAERGAAAAVGDRLDGDAAADHGVARPAVRSGPRCGRAGQRRARGIHGGGRRGAATILPPAPDFAEELRSARAALTAQNFDESVGILRDVAAKAGDTTPGIEAQIVLAHVYARQRLVDEAVAAYAAVVARYPTHPKAAEAMYYQAQAILGTPRADRDSEAHKLLSEIADRFAGHAFVPRALLARGEIESRRKNYKFDDVLGKAVPASLVTYRRLTGIRNGGREREHALWRLAQAYERVERFDLAAQAYRNLGEDYANTHYDAWASAARLYDRRLNDPVLARAAYQRVPSTSPAFKDAQKYVRSAS